MVKASGGQAVELPGKPRALDHVVSQPASEGMILLDVRSGMYFEVNEVGRSVWDLCDGQHTIDEIVGAVVAVYDASPEEIRADVVELLGELVTEGLLVPAA